LETRHAPAAKKNLAHRLGEARGRTRLLPSTVSDGDLAAQHAEYMSPLIWDYGHIGNYEELWLLNEAFGKTLSDRGLFDIYDASIHPREERPSLDMLDREDAAKYLDAVRDSVLAELEGADLADGDRLLRDGFVYHMILQHEAQHNETMLQTLELMDEPYTPKTKVEPPEGNTPEEATAFVPGGPFIMGTDDEAWVLDNERSSHEVGVPGFHMDTAPVTNRAYIEFVEDGGYEKKKLWKPEGWDWKVEKKVKAPSHWYHKESHDWWTKLFGFDEPLDLDSPVMHVSHHEAEAFARWAGKRLPTEAEWEKAASWNPETETKRLFPWGDEEPEKEHANLDHLAFRPAKVGAYPKGASAYGILGMVGDVWEWTSTEFHPYPGFESFPYKEYSEVFFGEGYRVLRGGSFATRPSAIRSTFRNWDHPHRRQLCVGFRCVV
jgi:iron(II)-dependent oxidoreductase